MLTKVNHCLSDRTNQLRIVKHFLLLVTVFSAVIYIVGFHLKRRQWHDYYESELAEHGFDHRVVGKFSEIMFITSIVFTIVFTIIFIHVIIKEILVGVLVVIILEFVSLVYAISLINQPIAVSSLEFIISAVEVMVGFMFAYLLKQKINEKKRRLLQLSQEFAA